MIVSTRGRRVPTNPWHAVTVAVCFFMLVVIVMAFTIDGRRERETQDPFGQIKTNVLRSGATTKAVVKEKVTAGEVKFPALYQKPSHASDTVPSKPTAEEQRKMDALAVTPAPHDYIQGLDREGVWKEVISDYPDVRVTLFHNLLSKEEQEHLMELAVPALGRATVVGFNGDVVSDSRTNTQTFLKKHQTPMVAAVEARLAKITGTREGQGEDLQVLRYQVGQQFTLHSDYFAREHKDHLARGGQRIATVLLWLRAAEEGGETHFPSKSLKLTPEPGDAILFYDVTPEGREDPKSMHAGLPVHRGEKWVATRWIREGDFF